MLHKIPHSIPIIHVKYSIHLKNNWIEANQFNSNKHFAHTWLSHILCFVSVRQARVYAFSCTCFLMYNCIKNIRIPFQHIIQLDLTSSFLYLRLWGCYFSFFSHLLCMKIFAFIIFGIHANVTFMCFEMMNEENMYLFFIVLKVCKMGEIVSAVRTKDRECSC